MRFEGRIGKAFAAGWTGVGGESRGDVVGVSTGDAVGSVGDGGAGQIAVAAFEWQGGAGLTGAVLLVVALSTGTGGVSAASSRRWRGTCRRLSREFARSATVSVAAQK